MTRACVPCTTCAVLMCLLSFAPVQAETLDFEDLWQGVQESHYLAAYGGFKWGETYWITDGWRAPSGYPNTIDGNVGISGGSVTDLVMEGEPFDLTSARVGAAWLEGQYVWFRGYRDRVLVYEDYFLAPTSGLDRTFNWIGIDRLKVTPDWTTGVPHEGWARTTHNICLDNLDLGPGGTEVTPELSSASLLLIGALPVGIAWWRRRKRS